MAEVTGSIGDQPVELNNAATEATLRLLLQSSLTANKQTVDEIKRLATRSLNIDPASLDNFNSNLNESTKSSNLLTKGFKGLGDGAFALGSALSQSRAEIKKFSSDLVTGTANVGDVFSPLTKLPGVFGLFFSGLQSAAGYLTETMDSYQKVSNAGINFGGSLTDLRNAAASTYLTLDQFGGLLKENTQGLIMIGGSVNSGAKAFAQFSSTFMKSEAGTNALALGYTFEGANSAMLTYLSVMGVNNKEQLKNDQSLRQGTANYLEELDRLAQITGKSREELNEKMKIEKLDADIAMTAARIQNKDEREAFLSNVRFMETRYGIAGKDMALAAKQGREVITKEGQLTVALAPAMRNAMLEMQQASERYGAGSKQAIEAQTKMALAGQDGFSRLSSTVISAREDIKSLSVTKTVAEEMMAGLTTTEAFEKRNAEIQSNILKRKKEEAEAKEFAEAQKALKDLTVAINQELTPVIKSLIPVIREFLEFTRDVLVPILRVFGRAIEWTIQQIDKVADGFKLLVDNITTFINETLTGLSDGFTFLTNGPLKGIMDGFAFLTNDTLKKFGFALGIIIPSLFGISKILKSVESGRSTTTTVSSPGGTKTGEKETTNKSSGKIPGVAKVGGAISAVTSALALASDFKTISEKNITEEEKSKEKTEATGEAIGSAAGGTIGAVIGSVLLPGIGTVIGGMLGSYAGSLAGRAGGEKVNEFTSGSKSIEAIDNETSAETSRLSRPPDITKKELPEGKYGGIFSGPLSGYPVMLHGDETVIPKDRISKLASLSSQLSKNVSTNNEEVSKTATSLVESPEKTAKSIENLQTELQMLNRQTTEMIRYLKDTADYARRNVDATNSLSGDFFRA